MSLIFCSINPYNGEKIGEYPTFSPAEIEKCLAQAHRAQKDWAGRRDWNLFSNLAKILTINKEKWAHLITLETGKLLSESFAEIEKCAFTCEFYAQNAPQWLDEQVLPLDGAKLVRQPLGVILGIMPWNFPFWQVIRFAIPTIAAGNTVLLKHAPSTMGCSLALHQAFKDAGFAEGIFNHLPISVEEVAAVLADRRVAGVSLTGSSRAGTAVASLAGRYLKKAVLELGGSDAFIVLKDADLEKACKTAFASRLINAGQSCIAAKRFIVEAPVYEDFISRISQLVLSLEPGNPLEATTTIAPLARADLKETLFKQVGDLQEATLIAQNNKPCDSPCYFAPMVLAGVRPDVGELFGPVFSILKAENENQAIALANDSPYGLGGSIWTQDVEKGYELALRIEAGCVFVNALVRSDARLPFGGIKDSGYGRELSVMGLYEFTNAKTIVVS